MYLILSGIIQRLVQVYAAFAFVAFPFAAAAALYRNGTGNAYDD